MAKIFHIELPEKAEYDTNGTRISGYVKNSITVSADLISFFDIDSYEMEKRGYKSVDHDFYKVKDLLTILEHSVRCMSKSLKDQPKYAYKHYCKAIEKIIPSLKLWGDNSLVCVECV